MKAILAAHYDSTMQRIERERCAVVLAVQDATSFNMSLAGPRFFLSTFLRSSPKRVDRFMS